MLWAEVKGFVGRQSSLQFLGLLLGSAVRLGGWSSLSFLDCGVFSGYWAAPRSLSGALRKDFIVTAWDGVAGRTGGAWVCDRGVETVPAGVSEVISISPVAVTPHPFTRGRLVAYQLSLVSLCGSRAGSGGGIARDLRSGNTAFCRSCTLRFGAIGCAKSSAGLCFPV